MDNAKLLLYMKKNDINAAQVYRMLCANLERVPEGYELLTAYTNGAEIVVMDDLDQIEEDHDCDQMGCGSLDHVLCRVKL